MVANTPINGWRTPQLTDAPPSIATAIGNLADDIDKNCLPVFNTLANRSAAMPTPDEGALSYCSETLKFEQYDAALSMWRDVSGDWKVLTAHLTMLLDTTYITVPNMIWNLEADAKYSIFGRINYRARDPDHFKIKATLPTGANGFWRGRTDQSQSADMELDYLLPGDNTDDVMHPFCGYILMSATPGSMTIQVAKNQDNQEDGIIFGWGTAFRLVRVG